MLLELADEIVTRKPSNDAHGHVDHVKLIEERGDVDAVATAVELLGGRPIREAHVQSQRVHDIVKGGV